MRTSRQPHRRLVRDDDRLSEKAESPLGRLVLKRLISEEQYQAGVLYAVDVGAYRAVIEGPRGTAGADRKGPGCEGGCAFMRKYFGDLVDCACENRKTRYDAAYAAVLGVSRRAFELAGEGSSAELALAIARAAGAKVQPLPRQDIRGARAVARVAIHGQEPAAEELVHLVRGLGNLARHYGLTSRRPLRHS